MKRWLLVPSLWLGLTCSAGCILLVEDAIEEAEQERRAPACQPGAQVSCLCPSGLGGFQRCSADGTFSPCACPPVSSGPMPIPQPPATIPGGALPTIPPTRPPVVPPTAAPVTADGGVADDDAGTSDDDAGVQNPA